MTAPLTLHVYRALTAIGTPLAVPFLALRLRRGKEDRERIAERRGRAGLLRPPGRLVWLHGASVGEAVSLLPFVERIASAGATALVTTGTVTSAALLSRRLPAGALHQYAPIDSPFFLRRFLIHWRPDAALIAESELWPNMIVETKRAGLPLAMINGRISERSFNRWRRAPRFIGALLAHFDLCLARSEADGERLRALGAPRVMIAGDIKYDAPALPADRRELAELSGLDVGPSNLDRRLDPRRRGADRRRGAQAARRSVSRRPDADRSAPSRARRGDPARDRGRGPCLRPALARRAAGSRNRRLYLRHDRRTRALLPARRRRVRRQVASPAGAGRIRSSRPGSPRAILHGPMVGNFADAYAALDAAGGALEIGEPERLGEALIALFADAAKLQGDGARRRRRRRAPVGRGRPLDEGVGADAARSGEGRREGARLLGLPEADGARPPASAGRGALRVDRGAAHARGRARGPARRSSASAISSSAGPARRRPRWRSRGC